MLYMLLSFLSCVERALTLKCDDQGDATEHVIRVGKVISQTMLLEQTRLHNISDNCELTRELLRSLKAIS